MCFSLPAIRTAALLAALVIVPAAADAQVRLQQVAENQIWPGFSLFGSSEFIAAGAVDGTDSPLVVGGNFVTAVGFPVPPGASWDGVFNPGGFAPSIFTGILREPTPGGGWHAGTTDAEFDTLQPFALFGGFNPSAKVRDLAVVDATTAYLVGTVHGAFSWKNKDETSFAFLPPNPNFTAMSVRRGLIATAVDGVFTDARFCELGMRPRAADTDSAPNNLFVFGQERDVGEPDFEGSAALLQRYALPPTSLPSDEIDATDDARLASLESRDVAVTTNDSIWIGGSLDGATGTGALGGSTDLLIGEADFDTTSVVNDFRLGSEDTDEWGAMAAGPNGELYVAFTIDGTTATFGSLSHNLTPDLDPGLTGVRHAFLGLIRNDGSPAWVVPLGLAKFNNAALIATGLDVDSAGNAYVSVRKTGQFEFLTKTYFDLGGGQVAVDGSGRILAYTPVTEVATPTASVAFDIERRFVLGSTPDGPTTDDLAFSTIEPDPITQSSYTICWADTTNTDIEALANLVSGTNGNANQGSQVTLVSSFPNLGLVCVSGILDPNQFITLDNNPDVVVDPDPLVIEPNGGGRLDIATAAGAGWALARLHDPLTLNTGPTAEFPYPTGFVTGGPGATKVRVYVIDKGIASTQSFNFQDLGAGTVPISFDGPGGLCVDALAHPTADGAPNPDTSSDHPKQAVNLIGAAALGSAQGTAMEFINVDMYSGAATQPDPAAACKTYLSFVSHAILQAVNDAIVRASPPINDPLPSIILIPSSGPVATGASSLLDGAINQALAFNIPVIVSAGNAGADVSGYVPARLGTLPGVITVGALAEGTPLDLNPPYDDNNTDSPAGSVITLYAPGVDVPTGEFGTVTGTSYSCALVAGIAATYMSFNPTATPAQVEQALIDFGYTDPQGRTLAQSGWLFTMWLYHNGLGALVGTPDGGKQTDSDGDGSNNLAEFLGRTDPNDPLDQPSIPSTVAFTSGATTLSLWLPDAVVRDDGSLGDSSGDFPFAIELSPDLSAWSAIDPSTGTFTAGSTAGDLRELRFEFTPAGAHQQECYLRTNFAPPPAP